MQRLAFKRAGLINWKLTDRAQLRERVEFPLLPVVPLHLWTQGTGKRPHGHSGKSHVSELKNEAPEIKMKSPPARPIIRRWTGTKKTRKKPEAGSIVQCNHVSHVHDRALLTETESPRASARPRALAAAWCKDRGSYEGPRKPTAPLATAAVDSSLEAAHEAEGSLQLLKLPARRRKELCPVWKGFTSRVHTRTCSAKDSKQAMLRNSPATKPSGRRQACEERHLPKL